VITFALGAFALLALTLAIVLRPLARDPEGRGAAESAANAAILRDQLAELERDHAAGTIAAAEYGEARLELKRRLLEDTAVADGAAGARPRRRWAAVATAVALPVTAAGLYLLLGSPAAFGPALPEPQATNAEIEAMVAKLAARLESRPEDLEGWAMLGRSYRVLGRNEDAARAYAKAESLIAGDPRALVDYAESLALAHGGNLQGKPAELVARALALDPSFALARMLSGAVAFQREDYATAIREWQQVQSRFPPDSDEARGIGESIARARELAAARPGPGPVAKAGPGDAKAASAGPKAEPGAKVAGTVRLADALAAQAAPTDTVFVYARAAGGPGAPLAVMRRQVKDLPLAFALDDSMAMAPDRKLSGAKEVVVGARISRSGNPVPQRGDLQGLSPPVKVGAAGVAVVIDTAVP